MTDYKFKLRERVKHFSDRGYLGEYEIVSCYRVYDLVSPANPRSVITVSEEDLEEEQSMTSICDSGKVEEQS